MKTVCVPQEYLSWLRGSYSDADLGGIDYTGPARRRSSRGRSRSSPGKPSVIFPEAPTVTAYVSDRNPYGTTYVQRLIEHIDSGGFAHELDDRRKG